MRLVSCAISSEVVDLHISLLLVLGVHNSAPNVVNGDLSIVHITVADIVLMTRKLPKREFGNSFFV